MYSSFQENRSLTLEIHLLLIFTNIHFITNFLYIILGNDTQHLAALEDLY